VQLVSLSVSIIYIPRTRGIIRREFEQCLGKINEFLWPSHAGALFILSRVATHARVLAFARRLLLARVHGHKMKSMFEKFTSEVIKE